jgi:hypothetical protein
MVASLSMMFLKLREGTKVKRSNMPRLRILIVAVLAAVMLVAGAASIQAQTVTPCMGGCYASAMPTAYDPAAMWAAYGYPHFSGRVW